jgi:CYTH domain-containing protein
VKDHRTNYQTSDVDGVMDGKIDDFIGMEVTGDKRFYNSHLLGNPFSKWRDTLPAEYR